MRLKERLAGVVPEEKLEYLSNRFHVIGDIAILSLGPELGDYQELIASALLDQCSSIHTVFNKTTPLEGEKRIYGLKLLAGEIKTITVHQEFGFRYHLDVSRVFFNSSLGYERMRVASQVRAGEEVLVPFAGVGPFAIPPAARGARVLALEKNKAACCWLAENARENRVAEMLEIINADAFYMAALLKRSFDRAIIPTPYGMDRIMDILPELVKQEGMIHYYTFKKAWQIDGLIKSYEDQNLEVLQCRRCGNVAPNVSRWAFDMKRL